MTFRVALTAAALLAAAGAAHAQGASSGPLVDRVVVSTSGKSMRLVRAELARAAEAVCQPDGPYLAGADVECVNATYASALRRAKRMRAEAASPTAATQVASR